MNQQHQNQSIRNHSSELPYSTINPLNCLSSSFANEKQDKDKINMNSNHYTSTRSDESINMDGGSKLGDQDEDDIDSLSDISTEKSENDDYQKSNRGGFVVKHGSGNPYLNEKSHKKRSRGFIIPPNSKSSSSHQQSEYGNSTTQNQSSISSVVDQKVKSKNREHAKKTRIRKKNFIESLKETVKQFAEEREKSECDAKIALSRLVEQTRVRKQVLQTMFFFRASNETDHAKWASILDENFKLNMPITPYRSFPPFQVSRGQRIVKGIDGMIKDISSLFVLIQSIGQAKDDGCFVRFQYYCELDDSIVNNDSLMCRWLMKTENAIERGARQEVYKHGMIEAIFTPQNKLLRLEMTFDVMSFMQQLRRSLGRYDFQVVPNTLALAYMDDTTDSRCIIEAVAPYSITYMNQNWCNMLGYENSQAINQPFSLLKGFDTESKHYNHLIKCFSNGESGCVRMTSYSANGSKLRLFIKVFPLYTNLAQVTHFLVLFEHAFDFPAIIVNENNNIAAVSNNLQKSNGSTEVGFTGAVKSDEFNDYPSIDFSQEIMSSSSIPSINGFTDSTKTSDNKDSSNSSSSCSSSSSSAYVQNPNHYSEQDREIASYANNNSTQQHKQIQSQIVNNDHSNMQNSMSMHPYHNLGIGQPTNIISQNLMSNTYGGNSVTSNNNSSSASAYNMSSITSKTENNINNKNTKASFHHPNMTSLIYPKDVLQVVPGYPNRIPVPSKQLPPPYLFDTYLKNRCLKNATGDAYNKSLSNIGNWHDPSGRNILNKNNNDEDEYTMAGINDSRCSGSGSCVGSNNSGIGTINYSTLSENPIPGMNIFQMPSFSSMSNNTSNDNRINDHNNSNNNNSRSYNPHTRSNFSDVNSGKTTGLSNSSDSNTNSNNNSNSSDSSDSDNHNKTNTYRKDNVNDLSVPVVCPSDLNTELNNMLLQTVDFNANSFNHHNQCLGDSNNAYYANDDSINSNKMSIDTQHEHQRSNMHKLKNNSRHRVHNANHNHVNNSHFNKHSKNDNYATMQDVGENSNTLLSMHNNHNIDTGLVKHQFTKYNSPLSGTTFNTSTNTDANNIMPIDILGNRTNNKSICAQNNVTPTQYSGSHSSVITSNIPIRTTSNLPGVSSLYSDSALLNNNVNRPTNDFTNFDWTDFLEEDMYYQNMNSNLYPTVGMNGACGGGSSKSNNIFNNTNN